MSRLQDVNKNVRKLPSKRPNEKFSSRTIRASALVLAAFSVMLVFALFKIQVVEHGQMAEAAAEQYYSNSFSQPRRGDIYDRNGNKLAGVTYVYRVGVTPKHVYSRLKTAYLEELIPDFEDELQLSDVKDFQEIVIAKLAQCLSISSDEVREALKQEDMPYIQLAKNIQEEQGEALENFLADYQIGGVRLDKEPKRYYTNGNLASQVIGFTSTDQGRIRGVIGIEMAFNDILSGSPGFSYGARDNYLSHGLLPYSNIESKSGADGNTLYLTLDMNIQRILQEDLESAIKAYEAVENGMAICINPYTGDILGMASYPYFRSDDPFGVPSGFDVEGWNPEVQETREKLDKDVWLNKNISNVYEAGSTMKAVTAAIGLEENVTREDNWYSDDSITVLDAEISCWTVDGHGRESMEEAFWRSCNPVFVQIAQAIGLEKFYNYIHAFGFYESTGIDLPGEAGCIFHRNPSVLDMANLSFGESSSVTPMHLLRAYCALVNGGKLITPHVIKEIRSADGKVLEAPGPNVVRRVISSETSSRVRRLLQGMVENSKDHTNAWGYSVGGKTSTSTDELTGQNTVSFVTAGPIEHPEVMTLMILQKPKNVEVGGSEAEIVTLNTNARIMDYLNIDRHYDSYDVNKFSKTVELPSFIGMTVNQAAEQMTYKQISIVAGDDVTLADSEIAVQVPPVGTIVFPGTKVYVYKEKAPEMDCPVPDLSGMNYNEIINTCNEVGLVAQFEGPLDGICVAQKSLAGRAGQDGSLGTTLPFGSILKVGMEIPAPAETGSDENETP